MRTLCEKNCCGCKVGHPSQRQHNCLMLTVKKKWDLHCKDAVALVNEKRPIWDKFLEATRVLKIHVSLESLKQLEKASEITLHTLWECYRSEDGPEMNCI